MYTIEKYVWINLKNQKVIEKSDSIYYHIKSHKLQSGRQLIALCSL
jgi:hypothetical protein